MNSPFIRYTSRFAGMAFAILITSPHPALAQEPAKATATLPAGNHTFKLQFGGKNREYIIHVPSGASAAMPLLLAFHGGGGEAAGFQKYTGLDAVSDREKFLVVYPYGTGVFARRFADVECWRVLRTRDE